MHESGIQQSLHHNRNATNAVDVAHHELAEWLEVSQVRNLVGDAVEVSQCQVDFSLTGDGQEVKNSIGRTAEGHNNCNRILEGLLRHDVASGDTQADHVDDGFTGAVGKVVAATVSRGWGSRTGKTHAECFGDRGHCVGRVHATTGAFAGADGALNKVEVSFAHRAGFAGAYGFKRVDDGDGLLGTIAETDPPGSD